MVQSIVLYNLETWTIKEDQKWSEMKAENLWDGCPEKDTWNNKKRQKTECGHIEVTPDEEWY